MKKNDTIRVWIVIIIIFFSLLWIGRVENGSFFLFSFGCLVTFSLCVNVHIANTHRSSKRERERERERLMLNQ